MYGCPKIRAPPSPWWRFRPRPRCVGVRNLDDRGCHRAERSRKALRRHHRRGRAGPRRARGHLPRTARAQRRRQVDHDAPAHGPGDRRRGLDPGTRPRASGRVEGGPRADGRRATARQPRRGRVGPGQPRGVRPALPRARRGRGRRPRAGAGAADRAPQRRGGQAVRRHAPAAAVGARTGPPAPAHAARRAHGRPRSPDPHRALVADRRDCGPRARRSSCRPTTSRRPSGSPTRSP